MKHLPNSSAILCASIDRDCHKERVSTHTQINFYIFLFEIILETELFHTLKLYDLNYISWQAYLFIKNCKDEWINTNLSAGKEYCCKDGTPYKC